MLFLIKKYRNYKKITLQELSTLTGYSSGYLNRIENNKRNPSMNTIEIIGHALEICPIRLLGGCHNHYCSSECFYYENNFSEFPKDAQNEIAEFLKYMRIKYNLD